MRVWIDIANSPHAGLFDPVVKHMHDAGWDVLLTARHHAQTAELARDRWPDVIVIGGESPSNRVAKAVSTAARSARLVAAIRRLEPDVALSHGSYAQIVAAAALRVPSVTLMDYEYQPANHLSFRLAKRVIVPTVFPSDALTRFGASNAKVRRYEGFKEELYLADFEPSDAVAMELGLDTTKIIVVLRPPPSGALYHPATNERFDGLLELFSSRPDVQMVLLPRTGAQKAHYSSLEGPIVPKRAVAGLSLLACADAVIGGGGTMNREAALLGIPTYTVFAGRLAAVDAALVRLGYMHDWRAIDGLPALEKREPTSAHAHADHRAALLDLILETTSEVTRRT